MDAGANWTRLLIGQYQPFGTHLDQADDLARFADDLEVLESLQQEGEIEGDDG